MASKVELACVYSALILSDDNVAITGEKIQTVLKAASVDVLPDWPGLFAKALEGVNVKDLITNVGTGVAGGPAPGGAPVAATVTEAAPVKKKEESAKSDDDMAFGLFE
ncbi:hypothetical protein Cfor_08613 [Coptotermes formosanus]|jgi:large subunit ribosomal protein LP1|uniref:Large ribosomal subunit protein P1 n=1 Tax=Coptotermes formosanus TaxID=36987 RepID=A0A6L2Q1I9_COPFO|nr:hypothetical protein Cfor_08613 [Coptotermes formosanus]